MSKKIKTLIVLFLILLILCVIFVFITKKDSEELRSIRSEKQLLNIYNGDKNNKTFIRIITMPFSLGTYTTRYYNSLSTFDGVLTSKAVSTTGIISESVSNEIIEKDYSKTNVQVENVDEADIIKTDGNYIYSISNNKVIITDVRIPNEIEIVSKISVSGENIPEDLILYNDKLIVIYAKSETNTYYTRYSRDAKTSVKIFDITNKAKPKLIKDYEVDQPYYTSRCINNMLYVISSGYLKKKNDKVNRTYKEDSKVKEIELSNIKYIEDIDTNCQTVISAVDLENVINDINISSYLMDISNAYVSEDSIYLLKQEYKYGNTPKIKNIFGFKGIIGLFDFEDENENNYSNYETQIYKFDILRDGNIKYSAKNKIDGKTINQYSIDEKDGHLRVATYDNIGSRVVILDEKLKQIGISDYLAKGETMYSSRFIGDKAYLVTYRTMDPLFVIDLSNETQPEVLGELKIPGYSTYLHPYDENHLIGIGMQTEEVVNRDSSGKVVSTTAKIIGMKMALFDVTDTNNPIQLSETVIGDRRTTSAILTNPKALLFSKRKNLIAIPVNNYEEDFEINNSEEDYNSMINAYKNYNKEYVAEGYFVYNINLDEGFKLKGIITHDSTQKNNDNYYYRTSKLLRGMYIEKNLYTISENQIKVNDLDTLNLVDEIKIK